MSWSERKSSPRSSTGRCAPVSLVCCLEKTKYYPEKDDRAIEHQDILVKRMARSYIENEED
jgi:hypothetical protein